MSFYRIAGAVILAGSAIFGSYIMNAKMTKTETQLEGFISLLRFIKNQIECYSLPVSEIFARCAPDILGAFGVPPESVPKDFEELSEYLRINDTQSAAAIKSFADEFGFCYREEQIKNCDYTLKILSERKKFLETEYPKKKRVNTTVCVCAALALIILML